MLRFFQRRWKRQAMVCLIAKSMVCMLGAVEDESTVLDQRVESVNKSVVFEGEFESSQSCLGELIRIIHLIELEQGWRVIPKNFSKIAIFLDLDLAPGLKVRASLVEGLLDLLIHRGYQKKDLFLVAHSMKQIIRSGYHLAFSDYEVITSEDSDYYDSQWYHDSPIPSSSADLNRIILKYRNDFELRKLEERKSYLPYCLFKENIWWISLAKASDDQTLGIRGAVISSTLEASDNTERFMNDGVMGPANAIEILAVPEFQQKHLFSIMDLSSMQLAGGTQFTPEFLETSDRFLISHNPVYLDYHAMLQLSNGRKNLGLEQRDANQSNLFIFAKELGFGSANLSKLVKKNGKGN